MAEPYRSLSKAAEQVRQFNHDSMSAKKDWEFPSHSYSALGNVSHLVGMLGQAIVQSTRPAMRTYEHGRLRIDNGGDADQAVAKLMNARFEAEAAAAALTAAVQRMHNVTSAMGLDTTGMPEFDGDGEG